MSLQILPQKKSRQVFWQGLHDCLTGLSVLQKLASDPRCKGMPLSSFLLKPMQRITRYPLLIRSVSPWDSSPSRPPTGCSEPDNQGAVIPLPQAPVCLV